MKGVCIFQTSAKSSSKGHVYSKNWYTDMRGSFFTLRTFHASSVNQWLVGKRVQGDALDKVNDQIIGLDLF